jgi:hypothetical protein
MGLVVGDIVSATGSTIYVCDKGPLAAEIISNIIYWRRNTTMIVFTSERISSGSNKLKPCIGEIALMELAAPDFDVSIET